MTEATTEATIRDRQRRFDEAELHADAATLGELLADDFLEHVTAFLDDLAPRAPAWI